MILKPQIISKDGIPEYVVISYKDYENILALLEDIEDIEDLKANENDESERFPLDVVHRIASGENAIKVFREYRKISQTAFAKMVGISKQYISKIENGERKGTAKILKLIAQSLGIDLDDLVP